MNAILDRHKNIEKVYSEINKYYIGGKGIISLPPMI